MPAEFAGGGTCGGIARGFMREGERTGKGAAKELSGIKISFRKIFSRPRLEPI